MKKFYALIFSLVISSRANAEWIIVGCGEAHAIPNLFLTFITNGEPAANYISTAAGTLDTILNYRGLNTTFSYTTTPGTASNYFGNNSSEFFFTNYENSTNSLNPGVIGTTRSTYNGTTCNAIESDIFIRKNVSGTSTPYTTISSAIGNVHPFSSSQSQPGGTSLQTVVTHEFGHTLGIDHKTNEVSVMAPSLGRYENFNNTTAYFSPGEYWMAHAGGYYGFKSTAKEELRALPFFKNSNISIQNTTGSTWGKIRIGAYNGAVAPCLNCGGGSEPALGYPIFQVNKGQLIYIESVLESSGKSSLLNNVPVGVYLSTNTLVSSSDTLLFQFTKTLSRDLPEPVSVPVTIPSGLANGLYILGVYIDNLEQVGEYSGQDNFALYYISVI